MSEPYQLLPQPRVHFRGAHGFDPTLTIVYDDVLLGRKGTSVIVSSEAEEGDFGASNLLTEELGDWYRSGSVAGISVLPTPEITLDFVLSEPRYIDWVSLHSQNIRLPWRADLYVGGSLAATTGWTNPIVKSEPSDHGYLDFPWVLGSMERRLADLAFRNRLQTFYHFEEPWIVDRVVVRVDCSEGVNGSVDWVQIGFPVAGRVFQTHHGPSLGSRQGHESNSIVGFGASGAKRGIKRPINTTFSFVLDNLTDDESLRGYFSEWLDDEGELARVVVYSDGAPAARRFFYDGLCFVGCLDKAGEVAVDRHPGETGDIFATKNVTRVTVRQTE